PRTRRRPDPTWSPGGAAGPRALLLAGTDPGGAQRQTAGRLTPPRGLAGRGARPAPPPPRVLPGRATARRRSAASSDIPPPPPGKGGGARPLPSTRRSARR